MLVAPGWAAGSPHHLWLAERPPQEALSVKKKEMENAWAEVLAGFGGFTWSRTDLATGTAQARAYGRKQLAPFVPWRLPVLPGARDPPLAFKTERRGKLPMTQALCCLTAIRCAALATCFARPSPVTSFPELFPAGGAGPEAPLRRGTTRGFCRVTRMRCHPLF